MEGFKRFAARHPVLFGLAITLLFIVMQVVVGALASGLGDAVQQNLVTTLGRLVSALVLVAILAGLGWLRAAGVVRLGTWQLWLLTLGILVYSVVLYLLAFFGDLRLAVSDPALAGAVALNHIVGVALGEELAFRALVLYGLVRVWGDSRRGMLKSVLISALIFGVVHILNALMVLLGSDKPLPMVLFQVVGSFLGGVYKAAIVLFGGSLWPAVILHGVVNAAVNVKAVNTPGFAETTSAWLFILLTDLPLVALGLYLLRRTKLRPVVPDAP